jgi:putative ABC transport system permease protein
MGLILKIAWRNIQRHRGKSLIIGAILFLGALIMTVGNGVISGMDKGLGRNMVHSFTGDIVLISDKQESDNVFLEFMGKAVEPINNFKDIKPVLAQQKYIDKVLPAGKNMAMVINEDGGTMGNAFLLGVDFARYGDMFPNRIEAIEGRLPQAGEKGALVPTGARDEFYDFTNIWFMPEGDTLHSANLTDAAKKNRSNLSIKTNAVLMGFNNDNTTTDIRLPIRGVVRYKALNRILGHFVLVDIESYRRCLGYFAASDKAVTVSAADSTLFSSNNENLDNMFSDNGFVVEKSQTVSKQVNLHSSPSANTAPATPVVAVNVDDGAYNMALILLKPGESLNKRVVDLNKVLAAKKLGVRAVTWKKAMGMIGSMAGLIKAALFVFVLFLYFVAIIIIMNTLSMAALERTTEIGMMRAVGARKGFISTMFLGETAILSAVFGGAGIAAGVLIVKIITACRFTTANDMLQLFYGGDTFHPIFTGVDLILTLILLIIVTLLAVIYPIFVARGITPLDAISRD